MPYHFVRRAGVLALAATMVVPQAGALSDVSSWAQEDIAAAQQAGLMPTSLADSSAREEITRAEFCAIAVKAYKQLTGKAVYASGQKFFRDTDDANVNAAYSLGQRPRQRLFRPEREHRASGSVRHSQQHPRQGRH